MAAREELQILLRTIADNQAAAQTKDALKQVQTEAKAAQQALTAEQQLANTVLRTSASQGGVSSANLQSIRDQIQRQVGAAPTLSPADLGIRGAASASSAGSTEHVAAINAATQASRDQVAAVRAAELANRNKAATLRATALAEREQAIAAKTAGAAASDAAKGTQTLFAAANIGTSDILRFAGALTGVQIGLSLFTSAGQAIRETITAASTALVEGQRVARATAAAYGTQATAFTAFARDLSAATGFTSNAILEAALSARTLSENYGLSIQQTQNLIRVSADLAQIRGIGVAEAFERVQSAIRGEAEASEFLGLTLNATFLKNRAMNGSLKDTFETMTDVQKAQVVYNELLRQASGFQGLAAQGASGLEGAQRRADLAAADFNRTLGSVLAPTLIALNRAQEDAARSAEALAKNLGRPIIQEDQARTALANRNEIGKLLEQIGITQTEFGLLTDTSTHSLLNVEQLADRLRVSWDQLLSVLEEGRDKFSGSAEGVELVRTAVSHLHPAIGALNTVAEVFGANFRLIDEVFQRTHRSIAQVAEDIGSLQTRSGQLSSILGALSPNDTGTRGQIQALQDLQQIDARVNAQRAAAAAERERQQEREATKITDPRDAAGARAARERLQVLDQIVPIEQARSIAAQAQSEAQARINVLDLQQQQHQLDVAKPLADLRAETLNREVRIADVQRQEADLADRITLASRQNLDLVRQAAQEKLNALPSGEALNDNQFEQHRLDLTIKANRADVRRGVLDPSALQDIPDQRQQLRQLRREAPRLELNAVEAERPGQLLERQVTREQLQQTIKLTTLQAQQQVLEDQLIPLRAAQRLTDERTAVIQRQLELQQLGETSARTAAQQNLIAANAVALAADLSVKRAIDWATNTATGLANIKQAWDLLGTTANIPSTPTASAQAAADAAGQAAIAAGKTIEEATAAAAAAFNRSVVPTVTRTVAPIPGQPPGGLVNPDRERPGAGGTSPSAQPTTRSGNTFNVNVTFTGPVNDPQAVAREVLAVLEHAADSAPQAAPVGLAGAIG